MTITLTLQCPIAKGDSRLSEDGNGDDVETAILLKGSIPSDSALEHNAVPRRVIPFHARKPIWEYDDAIHLARALLSGVNSQFHSET